MFHAQDGEDRWLATNWQRLQLPSKGVFVDIGAADGVTFSNTAYFEKVRNWTGLAVDADSRWWPELPLNRPGSTCINAAIGFTDPIMIGLDDARSGIAGQLRTDMRQVAVKGYRLSQLLDEHGVDHVDVISIDTEGTELEVWQTLEPRHYPRVAVMEWLTDRLQTDRRNEMRDHMKRGGYKLATTIGANLVFVPEVVILGADV